MFRRHICANACTIIAQEVVLVKSECANVCMHSSSGRRCREQKRKLAETLQPDLLLVDLMLTGGTTNYQDRRGARLPVPPVRWMGCALIGTRHFQSSHNAQRTPPGASISPLGRQLACSRASHHAPGGTTTYGNAGSVSRVPPGVRSRRPANGTTPFGRVRPSGAVASRGRQLA